MKTVVGLLLKYSHDRDDSLERCHGMRFLCYREWRAACHLWICLILGAYYRHFQISVKNL